MLPAYTQLKFDPERSLSQFLEMKVMLSSRGDLIIDGFHPD
jgi:hypothetical protein